MPLFQMFRNLLALILGFTAFGLASTQSIPTIKTPGSWFSIKQGLSQGMVRDIIQDKEGFMWFATKDGLNKYDGYHVSIYRNELNDSFSLPENHITQLLEDEFGNFWVGTLKNGLFLFDKQTEKFYPFNKLKTQVVDISMHNQALFVEYANNIFIFKVNKKIPLNKPRELGNGRSVLLNYNQDQKSSILRIDYNTDIQSAKYMPDGSIWFQTKEKFIQWKYNQTKHGWIKVSYSYAQLGLVQSNQFETRMTGLVNSKNKVYFFQNKTLFEYDIAKDSVSYKQEVFEEVIPSEINFNAISKNEIFLYANRASHIFNPQTKKIRPLYANTETGLDRLNETPFVDKNQIIWHPTKGWGIYKTDTRKQRFSSILPVSFHEALNKDEPDIKSKAHFPEKGLMLNFQRATKDAYGNYWFCPHNPVNQRLYLAKYDLKSKRITNYPTIHSSPYGIVLYGDAIGHLWLFESTDPEHNYIYQINTENGTIKAKYLIPLPRNYGDVEVVSQAYADHNNKLWLVTTLGLVQFNIKTKTFKTWHHKKSSVLSKDLLSIEADPQHPKDYVWIGSNGYGLIRFDLNDESTRIFNQKNGLPNDVVYRIAAHGKKLWFSSNKGISCFNPTTFGIQNFSEEDGLPTDEFNRHELMKLKDGQLLFGGVDGMVYFNPKKVTQKQEEVPLIFTELSLAGKPIDWKKFPDIIKSPISFCKNIALKPNQNNFTIRFATLEFRSPRNKLYKYRLMGFNEQWSAPSSKNEATFTNLSPGTYTLQVTGTNSDGVWNKEGIKINIQVLPAWYQTWLFRILALLALCAALYFLYRYQLRQKLKVLQVRNRIASDLHDELGSTLSSISMYSEAASKMKIENTQVKTVLDKINQNTVQVLESMSDIVWAVNTKNDQLHNIVNRMRNFAIQLAEAKGFVFTITDNSKLPDIPIELNQRKNLYLIFKEAVNNTAKYANCMELKTQIEVKKNGLIMSIVDNGVGFELLERQNENEGNGLYNMRRRALDIGAVFKIHSKKGQGTQIEVHMPLTVG